MQLRTLVSVAALSALVGCTSVDLSAPIEDRSTQYAEPHVPVMGENAQTVPVPTQDAAPHLVKEAAPVDSGRVHTVVTGDTIWNISQRYGCNPRELMRLNGITDPTTLSLGRELNIPTTKSDGRKVPEQAPVSTEGEVVTTTAPVTTVAKRPETPDQVAQRELAEQQAKRDAAARGEIEIRWPTQGEVIANFEQTGGFGIDIAGSRGQSVMAVLDGTVQYVGNNTAGYGRFVIVRHNIRLPGKAPTPLTTVYGNNDKVIVSVGESVRAGQKIAEMGDSDTDRVKLRFEIRQGKPLDPMLYVQQR